MNVFSAKALAHRTWLRLLLLAVSAAVVFSIGGCGDDDDDDASGGPFDLIVQPEFVQGMYANLPVTVLVTIADGEGGSGGVSLIADFDHGTATVTPTQISDGQIAHVTVTAESVSDEIEATLTITATRANVEQKGERRIFVMPGEDDRESTARDLLAVFTRWLQENHPEFGITADTSLEGRLVAPRLLVVSHYMFENDEYELGISWHIMVPPDDWSELYIRPKDSLEPTMAFRLSSWSTALDGGDVSFTEVDAPAEIVR
jgi:hypothetical protein